MHFSMMKDDDASPHAKHNTLIHVQNEKCSIPIWKNCLLSSWT